MNKHSNIVRFPADQAAVDRAGEIEDCMNNIAAIVTLLHETVEGERFMNGRAWLADQLDNNFGALDAHLSARSTTVAGAHV
jgi:primosomal protein N''